MTAEQPTHRDDTILSNVPLIPRRVFFGNPQALDPILSPDGRWLAWLAPFDGVMNIWVAPRDDLSAACPLTRQLALPIERHWFARTNAHLLFALDRDGDENFNIWRVGLDGSAPRNLTPCANTMAILIGMHLEKPNLVAVALNDRDSCWHDLYVIDIMSGERRLVYENLDDISTFVVDSELNLRLATTMFDRDGGLGLLCWDGEEFHEIMSIGADDALVTAPLHFTRKGDRLVSAQFGRSRQGGAVSRRLGVHESGATSVFALPTFIFAHSTVKCNGRISGAEENLARGLPARQSPRSCPAVWRAWCIWRFARRAT